MDAPSILKDLESLERVATDRSGYVPDTRPDGVVVATSIDDVVATLRYASAHRIPVVTRGAGSGLAGGSSASKGMGRKQVRSAFGRRETLVRHQWQGQQ